MVTSDSFLIVVELKGEVAEVSSSTLCEEPTGVLTLFTLRFCWVTPPAAFNLVYVAEDEDAEPATFASVADSVSVTPSTDALRVLERTLEFP